MLVTRCGPAPRSDDHEFVLMLAGETWELSREELEGLADEIAPLEKGDAERIDDWLQERRNGGGDG